MSKYIPSTDSGLRDWSQNFSNLITANPSTYGLMVSDAVAIAGAVGAYVPALSAAVDPVTRTKGTVAAKDSAKAAMLITLRRYAQFIKLNVAVTNQEKQNLGINVDDTSHTPIPAPTTKPVCTVVDSAALQHTLRYADATTPNTRAKPPGVDSMELYFALAATAPTTPPATPDKLGTGLTLYTLAARQPVTVTHDPAAAGKTVIYFARWATHSGLVGPWSDPIIKMVAP